MARAENINPGILRWARESAGFSLEDAAERLQLASTAKKTAAEKLAELEAGKASPTRAQLSNIAKVYRRPLLTFYMADQPVRVDRGEDFRSLAAEVTPAQNGLLDALLRDIRARQEMVRSLLEVEEEAGPLAFVGSMRIEQGVQAVVDSIALTLGFAAGERLHAGRSGSPEELFKELRQRAERAGIFVILVADLGSHHSAISEKVFRGFVIADPIAPFVVINAQDAKAAWSFTLIHELAHIWLGQTGISGAPEFVTPGTREGLIEQFCNDVASEFLLPAAAFRVRPAALADGSFEAARAVVSSLAREWSVSEPMIAYKLSRLGWIQQPVYQSLVSEYAARWAAMKQRMREKAREREDDSGPSPHVIRKFRLGDALVDVVRRTLRENALSYTKAAKVLGVKPSGVEPLVRALEHKRGGVMPERRQ